MTTHTGSLSPQVSLPLVTSVFPTSPTGGVSEIELTRQALKSADKEVSHSGDESIPPPGEYHYCQTSRPIMKEIVIYCYLSP